MGLIVQHLKTKVLDNCRFESKANSNIPSSCHYYIHFFCIYMTEYTFRLVMMHILMVFIWYLEKGCIPTKFANIMDKSNL